MANPKVKKEEKYTTGGAACPKNKFNATAGPFVRKDENLNKMGMEFNCGEGIQVETFFDILRKLGEHFRIKLDFWEDIQETVEMGKIVTISMNPILVLSVESNTEKIL